MQQKKKNILEKIVKKNYNNELEEILEYKQFKENVRSTLLSILYKVETAYDDLKTVKKDVETKEEYISKIINIIKKDCDSIEIVKMTDEENKIPNKKTFIIDKKHKKIISYPIERKVLYAIAKISKKDRIVKDKYFIINETLSNLINVGNNIEMIEPLRDFNGYSWNTTVQEIESIDHNLIYQNLRILIGNKFLNNWVKDEEVMIDYFESLQEKLEEAYGEQLSKEYVELLCKISILLELKFNKDKEDELRIEKDKVDLELEKMKDNTKFIESITKEKREVEEQIRRIDTVMQDKELLQEEYKIRNEKLPLEKKIFSMRILSKIMQEERQELVKKIEELNNLLVPKNFVTRKKELEHKQEYLKIVDLEDKEKSLDKLKLEAQILFLKMIEINIDKETSKQGIEKIIYDLRYYLLLPYNYNENVNDVKKLKKQIEKIEKKVIKKAIELKEINKISDDLEMNYEILKNIFTVRIIKLEDAYLKITKEKSKTKEKFKYFVQIFDENIFEEKIEIQEVKNLEIKPNKKVAIWN